MKKVFAGRKVDEKLDNITSFDLEKKQVIGEENTYDYDYLVLSAGSKPTFYGVTGAEENTFKLWSYDDAVLLKEHILNIFRKAGRERNEEQRRKMLTFYVVGAGFTGVEMIGELAEYVPYLCEQYGVERKEVTLVNIDGLNRPIPNLPEKLSNKVSKRLHKMGVELCLEAPVVEVGADFITYKKDGKDVTKPVSTVIWGAGIQACDITASAAECMEKQRGNRIQVDKFLRSTTNEDVYVIGDNMYFVAEGEQAPVPQMVENCEQSSHTAAHNIVSQITGKGKMEEYKPAFHGVMVCIGG